MFLVNIFYHAYAQIKDFRIFTTTFLNSKFILIQQLYEHDWIKSRYIKHITYKFSVAIGLMFMIHETLPNKRKLKK